MEGFDEQMSFLSSCEKFLQSKQQLLFLETTIVQLQLDIHPHNCMDEKIVFFLDYLRTRKQEQSLAYYYMILADVYEAQGEYVLTTQCFQDATQIRGYFGKSSRSYLNSLTNIDSEKRLTHLQSNYRMFIPDNLNCTSVIIPNVPSEPINKLVKL